MIWQTADTSVIESICDHMPTCRRTYSNEVRPMCPRCALEYDYDHILVREYDEYNKSIRGRFMTHLSNLFYQTKPARRRFKWMAIALLNAQPKTRVLYPLAELLTLQRLYIVEDKWYLARTAEDAARYWAYEFYDTNTVEVTVSQPFAFNMPRVLHIKYIGQGEFMAFDPDDCSDDETDSDLP